jgi:hypothetical protein
MASVAMRLRKGGDAYADNVNVAGMIEVAKPVTFFVS